MSTTTATTTQLEGATLRLRVEPDAVQTTSTGASTHKQDLASNPFQRVWRGNREGTIKMPGVPTFDDKHEERTWVKQHMAGCFRYWGKLGFGEGTAGHITVRDPVLPDHYWMNPFGMHFSLIKVSTIENVASPVPALMSQASDLVLVGPDGYVTEHGAQLPINEAGYVIHHTLHQERPDVAAAAHCHSFYGRTWAAFGKSIDIMQQDACLFNDNLSVYGNYGGIVLSNQEGKNIADALGPKNLAVIMQNHGLLTRKSSIARWSLLADRHSRTNSRRMRLFVLSFGEAVSATASRRVGCTRRLVQNHHCPSRRCIHSGKQRVLGDGLQQRERS